MSHFESICLLSTKQTLRVEILADSNLEGVFAVTLVPKKGFASVGFGKVKWNFSEKVIYRFGRVPISLAVLKRFILSTELSEDSNFESTEQDDPVVGQMRNHRCYRWFRRSFAYLLNIYKNFWSFYQELVIFGTTYLDSCWFRQICIDFSRKVHWPCLLFARFCCTVSWERIS